MKPKANKFFIFVNVYESSRKWYGTVPLDRTTPGHRPSLVLKLTYFLPQLGLDSLKLLFRVDSLIKLLFRIDEGYRTTREPANSEKLLNRRHRPVL